MPHFLIHEVVQLIGGVLLGAIVILFPGFCIGSIFNLLRFNLRSYLAQLGISVILGLSITPILFYLIYRFLEVKYVMVMLLILATGGIISAINKLQNWNRKGLPIVATALIWCGLALSLLLDLQIRDETYYSSFAYDQGVRVQEVTALSHTQQLPLTNFLYFPGRPVPVRYHYFSYIVGSLIQRLSADTVSARLSYYAAIVWIGIGLLATIGIYLYDFVGLRQRSCAYLAFRFLLIGGLQVLPFLALSLVRLVHRHRDVIPYATLTWWNAKGQVTGWIDSMFWVPNHVMGMLAFLTGCLLLWEAGTSQHTSRWLSAVFAGLAFASGAGLSIFIAIVFAIFLIVVTGYCLLRNRSHAWNLVCAGVLSLIVSLPFLLELTTARNGPAIFALTPRIFEPTEYLIQRLEVQTALTSNLLYSFSLPLNYLSETGFFFLVSAAWLWSRLRSSSRLSSQDRLMMCMVVICLGLCSFVRSFPGNDLGWRGLLPAQFVALLWATQMTLAWKNTGSCLRTCAIILAAIGLTTTFVEVALLRAYIPLADRGLAASTIKLIPTSHAGLHIGELKTAYLWLRRHSKPDSVVQQNPSVPQEIALGLYAERRTAIYGREFAPLATSEELQEFRNTYTRIAALFEFGTNSAQADSACQSLKIDYLVVQDSDPVWNDRESFVWSDQPVFEAPLVRVIQCGTSHSHRPIMEPQ